MKTGPAFSDHIKTEKLSHRSSAMSQGYGSYTKRNHIRIFFVLLFTIFLFGALFVKLFSLQIVQGSYYRNLSDQNRVKTSIIHAPRGIIFDRNNKPLVFNMPGFRKEQNGKTIFLDHDQALKLIAQGEKGIEIDTLRYYPFTESLAHVLGYIGQITESEIKDKEFVSYNGNDIIGKTGIERFYEQQLRGVDGKQLGEVNAMGKTVRTLGQTDPVPGKNITLTIDSALQQAAYDALKDTQKGTVIASTPNGEILAMVSKPSFDPNLFTMGQDYKPATDAAYQELADVLLDGENNPLLNRAIGGTYPPGSTFKLITAAAGLENKVIDDKYEVEDTGVLKVGAFSFANWYFTQYGRTEGPVDVVKAIKRSNDIFFYKIAALIGVDRLSEMARKFDLGKQTEIDLGGEASGVVPDDTWKRKVIGEQWYLGDNYHYGIGQGYLLTTPLQVNVLTQAVANSGTIYEPHLRKDKEEKIHIKNFLSSKTISLIREGMIESCSPTGVAWPLFEFKVQNSKLKVDGKNFLEVKPSTASAGLKGDIKDYRQVVVACKTGTAQHGGEQTLPHAWITLYAPAYDPQVVVTVLAESSGEGSSIAGPIAKKVLEAWFERR